MQKQVRKLRFFLLLGAAFLLISCEKAPNNLKEPLESKSGFLVYDEPLNYLNNLRIKSGLNQLKQNQILDLAALNHAKYVVANSVMSHDEIQGKIGFTGENPSKRAEFVGYNSSVRENISFNADDLQSAIDGLMSAIYHRFAFLDFEIDEVGIAYFKNEKDASYAFEMGNSSLERFCSANKNDEGNGRFILGMCKDKTLKMKSDKFEMANRLNSTPFVYFPNSEPQQAFFSNEIPDPIPECKITANPISIEFNKFAKPVKMQSFKIYKNGVEITDTKILDKKSDPNGILNDRQFVLFSKSIFEFDAEYEAKFSYTQDGENKTHAWKFKTSTPKNNYFVAKDGDNLGVMPDIFYDIFITPKDCNDLLSSYKASSSFMNKPEISNPHANTLRVKLSGAKGSKLKITTNDGKVINVFLKEKSKNYKQDPLIYAVGGIILAIIIFYFLARKRR